MYFFNKLAITVHLIACIWAFQQNKYILRYERADYVGTNTTYIEVLQWVNYKYNRTCAVTNGTFYFKTDLDYDLKVIVQAYRFSSNEYRLYPLRYLFDLCTAIKNNDYGIGAFAKYGDVKCPLKKGHHTVYNFAPDASRFPPLVPAGRYLVDLEFVYKDMQQFTIKGYGEIQYPL